MLSRLKEAKPAGRVNERPDERGRSRGRRSGRTEDLWNYTEVTEEVRIYYDHNGKSYKFSLQMRVI